MTAHTNQIARRLGGLPPDPDGANAERSSWAETALRAFEQLTHTDPEDALSDLLADLMHWCDRNDVDFDDQLRRGRAHYLDETSEEFP